MRAANCTNRQHAWDQAEQHINLTKFERPKLIMENEHNAEASGASSCCRYVHEAKASCCRSRATQTLHAEETHSATQTLHAIAASGD
jgi:hypothetical protein